MAFEPSEPRVGCKRWIDLELPPAKRQDCHEKCQNPTFQNINSPEWQQKILTAISPLNEDSKFIVKMAYDVCKRDYQKFPNEQVEIMNKVLDCLVEPDERQKFRKLAKVCFDIDLIFNEIYERE